MSGNPVRRDPVDDPAWEAPAVVVHAAPLLIGVPEAGWMLGLSPKTIRRMMAGGDLKSVRVGGRRLLPVADLAAWAAALPREGRARDISRATKIGGGR